MSYSAAAVILSVWLAVFWLFARSISMSCTFKGLGARGLGLGQSCFAPQLKTAPLQYGRQESLTVVGSPGEIEQ